MTDTKSPSRPTFLERDPVELKFGTSGLRGLVRDMTDLEVSINVQGFLRFALAAGHASLGDRVAVAQDLRDRCPDSGIVSSPRIARAVMWAIETAGFVPVDLGQVPTPALATYATEHALPGIMVTGSHIPADRNGVKFYLPTGEVLKSHEGPILDAVRAARDEAYAHTAASSPFDAEGRLRSPPAESQPIPDAVEGYQRRYLGPFGGARPLEDMTIVFFQHTSVARDILTDILEGLGAKVVPEERVNHFVPVDTEDVMPDDEARYRGLVNKHRADALISTDGDGDRPLIVDEKGRFHRGDAVGIITARFLGAKYAAVPVSAYDAIDLAFAGSEVAIQRTRIGSPWVIDAMNAAREAGRAGPIVGWEANGGFLTGTEVSLNGHALSALPTRDATLPIVSVLLAARRAQSTLSQLFGALPARATRAGLLDDFDPVRSKALLSHVRPTDSQVAQADLTVSGVRITDDGGAALAGEPGEYLRIAATFEKYFPAEQGFGRVTRMNFIDGVRVWFDSDDIVHLRPSGNAPQFRIYTVAGTPARADEVVDRAIAEPDGTLRTMERDLLG